MDIRFFLIISLESSYNHNINSLLLLAELELSFFSIITVYGFVGFGHYASI